MVTINLDMQEADKHVNGLSIYREKNREMGAYFLGKTYQWGIYFRYFRDKKVGFNKASYGYILEEYSDELEGRLDRSPFFSLLKLREMLPKSHHELTLWGYS